MVVDDLDVMGVTCLPAEAYPPLIVDSNAVLATSITPESFQPIAGRRAKIVQPRGPMQQQQLAAGDTLNRAEPRHRPIVEQPAPYRGNERS